MSGLETYLDANVHVGNFAEVKKSRVGRGTRLGHFSYVGDAKVGAEVNIGAGTVTCNFDGRRKNKTVIGDGAFIGSDTMLVAPVEVGSGGFHRSGICRDKRCVRWCSGGGRARASDSQSAFTRCCKES